MRPAREQLGHHASALGGGSSRFVHQREQAVAAEVIEAQAIGASIGGATDLARQAFEEGVQRSGDARSVGGGIEPSGELHHTELRLQRHEPPPALAQIAAKLQRQPSGEEALHPRPVGAPFARTTKLEDPALGVLRRLRLR
jgi:hypothetical protein